MQNTALRSVLLQAWEAVSVGEQSTGSGQTGLRQLPVIDTENHTVISPIPGTSSFISVSRIHTLFWKHILDRKPLSLQAQIVFL